MESSISLQERGWSMSSTRLEQIVAALIKPVSNYAQSFDRDDSGMLELYLTEAGLRAMEQVEAGEEPQFNFAEMGLVLQGFASNYCKKVDLLSRLTNDFYNRLLDEHNNNETCSPNMERKSSSPGQEATPRRRPGFQGSGFGFGPIELVPSSSARRESGKLNPPPVLPRGYAELQPRAAAAERTLIDYNDEPIGSLDDFRVAWRLHDGFLVEELEDAVAAGGEELGSLSLVELQEACSLAEASTPPPYSPPPPPLPTSPQPPTPPQMPPTELMPPPAALKRKRQSAVRVEDLLIGSFNLDITEVVRKHLAEVREFSLSEEWVRRVVRYRKDQIVIARRFLEPDEDEPSEKFRGYDYSWMDIGGFLGFTQPDALAASKAAKRAARELAALESDDDDFYEQSSDSARFSLEYSNQVTEGPSAEAESWQSRVARRAEAGEPLHLPSLARDVRRVLEPPGTSTSWEQISFATRHKQPQSARVLLDILMKASRGEVEIEQGAPLSIGQFSVRLLAETPVTLEEELSQQLSGPPPPSLPPPTPPEEP